MVDLNRISILIATWDADSLLKGCMDSLVSVYGRLPSTVVVDNANLCSTAKLSATYENVKYVPAPENLGFAGGNNLGYPHCGGEYVVLLNNDVEFTADSLSDLISFMDAHPKVGAVQGRLVRGDDRQHLDYCGLQLTPIGQTAALGLGASVADPRFSEPYPVFAASGALLVIRKSAIEAIGGTLFHDEFRSYYEDVDLGQRLWMCGYEVWYCPSAPVVHWGSRTAKRFDSGMISEQGYCNRWYSLLMSYHFSGLLYLGTMLVILFWGHALVSLVRGDGSAIRVQVSVLRKVFANRVAIATARERFLPFRKVSDFQLLRRLMVRQPWGYYWNLIRQN